MRASKKGASHVPKHSVKQSDDGGLRFERAKPQIPEEHPMDKTSPQTDKGILDSVSYSNYRELYF